MLDLSLACQVNDRTRALLDGHVPIDGCRITHISGPAEEIFQRAFRHQEFDIAELSLGTHLLTTARGQSRYIGIPAFVSRSFRHSAIYVGAGKGIDSPESLRGRRIGIPDFQQTAGVWVRGLLADEFNVRAADVHWLMGGLEQAGREPRVRFSPPAEIVVEPIASTKTLSGMLASGEIDALISPRPPSCYGRDGKIRRLFEDYRADEEAYFEKTGIFPIMHLIGIRRELVERHPWLPVNVYQAFSKARSAAACDLSIMDTLRVMHPWMLSEVDKIKALMGRNYWRYGIKENKKELDTLQRYALSDGLIDKKVLLEDLFALSTFDEFNF